MDQNMQNGTMIEPQAEQKKVGPIVAILIIVLVLVIAALYLFASRITQPVIPDDTAVAGAMSQDPAAQQVQPVTSTSDNPSDIQNDLDNSTKGLDSQNF